MAAKPSSVQIHRQCTVKDSSGFTAATPGVSAEAPGSLSGLWGCHCRSPLGFLECRGSSPSVDLQLSAPVHVQEKGIELFEGRAVAAVEDGRLLLDGEPQRAVPFDECLWCTQAAAPAWLAGHGAAARWGPHGWHACAPMLSLLHHLAIICAPHARRHEPFAVCMRCACPRAAQAGCQESGNPLSYNRDLVHAADGAGFVRINECLQAEGGPPNVFAVGDVASSSVHPRPKAGVFAVRQGMPAGRQPAQVCRLPPIAAPRERDPRRRMGFMAVCCSRGKSIARLICRLLKGEPLKPFVPQSTFLSLITTGDQYAVGTKGPLLP